MDIRAIHATGGRIAGASPVARSGCSADSRNRQPASVQEQLASLQAHPVLTAEEQRYFEGCSRVSNRCARTSGIHWRRHTVHSSIRVPSSIGGYKI
jgi:hypothetical protein